MKLQPYQNNLLTIEHVSMVSVTEWLPSAYDSLFSHGLRSCERKRVWRWTTGSLPVRARPAQGRYVA
jgi:hypothetical protein